MLFYHRFLLISLRDIVSLVVVLPVSRLVVIFCTQLASVCAIHFFHRSATRSASSGLDLASMTRRSSGGAGFTVPLSRVPEIPLIHPPSTGQKENIAEVQLRNADE